MRTDAPRRRVLVRRAVIGVGLLAAALGLAEWSGLRRTAWRAAYPHLPARVQALPYVAAGEIRRLGGRSDAPPAPLPTSVLVPAERDTPPDAAPPGRPGDVEPEAAVPAPVSAALRTPTPDVSPALDDAPRAGQEPIDADRRAPDGGVDGAAPGGGGAARAPTDVAPPAASVSGLRHEYQTWNNCGPATVSMALSAFGWPGDQRLAAVGLKPDPDDKNVGPHELARFARENGLNAVVRSGGTIERLTALLAAGLPVIVETWFIPEPGDEMGHYVLLTGYDAGARTFFAFDSYNGPDVALPWDTFDSLWRVFGRLYVVVYPDAKAERVASILGPDMDERSMWVAAAATARQETIDRDDAFAHFNLGSALMALDEAEAAARAFDAARARDLPWRMLWYQFAPYEAYGAVGRWQDVLALADATLARVDNLEESLYWRGRARAALGDAAGARADWRQAMQINPLFLLPQEALDALEAQDG